MYVRGQSMLAGLFGLGDFPGTAYIGRNAAEVRAMERCLTQGGRCRVVPPGPIGAGYIAQRGLCPGGSNVQCVIPETGGDADAGFDFAGDALRHDAAHVAPPGPGTSGGGLLASLFNRPGGSAAPGMPGNVNVQPAAPGTPDPGIIRSYTGPISQLSTGAKVAMVAVAGAAAIALGVVLFKKPKAAAKTTNRRRRNGQKKPERIYYYRGPIERSHGLRGYKWHNGYSSGSAKVIEFPWMTKAEARKEAARDGFRAVFRDDHPRRGHG